MKYLLDANACVTYLRYGKTTLLAARVDAQMPGDIVLCAVVEGELHFGALRSNDPVKVKGQVVAFTTQFHILPFNSASALEYAFIREYLTRMGQIIGSNDLKIAATARANGLILVTHNPAEFNRVPGLQLEDWQMP